MMNIRQRLLRVRRDLRRLRLRRLDWRRRRRPPEEKGSSAKGRACMAAISSAIAVAAAASPSASGVTLWVALRTDC